MTLVGFTLRTIPYIMKRKENFSTDALRVETIKNIIFQYTTKYV